MAHGDPGSTQEHRASPRPRASLAQQPACPLHPPSLRARRPGLWPWPFFPRCPSSASGTPRSESATVCGPPSHTPDRDSQPLLGSPSPHQPPQSQHRHPLWGSGETWASLHQTQARDIASSPACRCGVRGHFLGKAHHQAPSHTQRCLFRALLGHPRAVVKAGGVETWPSLHWL